MDPPTAVGSLLNIENVIGRSRLGLYCKICTPNRPKSLANKAVAKKHVQKFHGDVVLIPPDNEYNEFIQDITSSGNRLPIQYIDEIIYEGKICIGCKQVFVSFDRWQDTTAKHLRKCRSGNPTISDCFYRKTICGRPHVMDGNNEIQPAKVPSDRKLFVNSHDDAPPEVADQNFELRDRIPALSIDGNVLLDDTLHRNSTTTTTCPPLTLTTKEVFLAKDNGPLASTDRVKQIFDGQPYFVLEGSACCGQPPRGTQPNGDELVTWAKHFRPLLHRDSTTDEFHSTIKNLGDGAKITWEHDAEESCLEYLIKIGKLCLRLHIGDQIQSLHETILQGGPTFEATTKGNKAIGQQTYEFPDLNKDTSVLDELESLLCFWWHSEGCNMFGLKNEVQGLFDSLTNPEEVAQSDLVPRVLWSLFGQAQGRPRDPPCISVRYGLSRCLVSLDGGDTNILNASASLKRLENIVHLYRIGMYGIIYWLDSEVPYHIKAKQLFEEASQHQFLLFIIPLLQDVNGIRKSDLQKEISRINESANNKRLQLKEQEKNRKSEEELVMCKKRQKSFHPQMETGMQVILDTIVERCPHCFKGGCDGISFISHDGNTCKPCLGSTLCAKCFGAHPTTQCRENRTVDDEIPQGFCRFCLDRFDRPQGALDHKDGRACPLKRRLIPLMHKHLQGASSSGRFLKFRLTLSQDFYGFLTNAPLHFDFVKQKVALREEKQQEELIRIAREEEQKSQDDDKDFQEPTKHVILQGLVEQCMVCCKKECDGNKVITVNEDCCSVKKFCITCGFPCGPPFSPQQCSGCPPVFKPFGPVCPYCWDRFDRLGGRRDHKEGKECPLKFRLRSVVINDYADDYQQQKQRKPGYLQELVNRLQFSKRSFYAVLEGSIQPFRERHARRERFLWEQQQQRMESQSNKGMYSHGHSQYGYYGPNKGGK